MSSPSTLLWKQIAQSIEAAIADGKLAVGERLPSEVELAAQWHVCRMTAHRAMQELQRRGIVERRRRHGTFVAPASARRAAFHDLSSIEGAKPGVVAVLSFASSDYPTAAYLSGIRHALPRDTRQLFFDTGEGPQQEARLLEQMQHEADGILCMPTCAPENSPLLRRIVASGLPIVCLDRVPPDVEIDAVLTDNYASSVAALQMLVERGHRRIAHFTDYRPQVSSTRERLQAFGDVMRQSGESDVERWTRFFTAFVVERDHYYEHLRQAVHDALFALLQSEEPPTAIFCLQDNYMAAVLETCAEMGVAVPSQLEVLSFNDCPPALLPLLRGVHRIVQNPQEMGAMAATRLLRRIQGEILPAEIVRVPAQIHVARNVSALPSR